MDTLLAPAQAFLGPAWPLVWTLLKIIVITVPLILAVAYLTLAERKVIGWMQVRIGPNRVGPLGLLQPFADVFKLLIKEIIIPSGANKFLFTKEDLKTPVRALSGSSRDPDGSRPETRRRR